ncbi:MAG: hypothetical protein HY738_00325 [Bacteroidia bacterium]|nr:hypothetical protein [Bacteroidia bacterium]
MKKIVFFAILTFPFLLLLPSCQECTTCSYVTPEGTTVTSGEICGNKEKIEDTKKQWMEYEETYGVVVTCE